MRIITLTINAFSYIYPSIHILGAHFFSCIPDEYTPLIEANPREYLIPAENQSGQIMINRSDLPQGVYMGYFSEESFTEGIKLVEYTPSYARLAAAFTAAPQTGRLSPIYIKPPKITCPTK